MKCSRYIFLLIVWCAANTATAQGYLSSRTVFKNAIVAPRPVAQTQAKAQESKACFPLAEDHVYEIYDYVIDLRNEKVQQRYAPLFAKYDYHFSGYVLEDMMQLILNDATADLRNNVILRSEAELVTVTVTCHYARAKFRQYMCRYLNNLPALEAYIRKADRKKVSEY